MIIGPRALGDDGDLILAGTLGTFGLPLEGISVLLGVDALMDMARTSVNVLGNCMATAVVARWEGYDLGTDLAPSVRHHDVTTA